MRRLATLGLAALLACAGPSRESAPDPTPRQVVEAPPPAPQVTVPVITVPEPGAATVAFRIEFRSGAVDDPAGKEGLTALTAELMAEGGTADLSSSDLVRALYPMAAELSVVTAKETTVFVGRCPKQVVDRFVPILLDVVLRPRLDPHELDRLRSRALDFVGKTLRSEDDEALGKAALALSLYGQHRYAHPTRGTVQGLGSITLEDVRAQRERTFVTARLVVGVAGAYARDLPDRLARALASLPAGAAPPPVPAPSTPGPRFLLVEKGTEPTAISMGFTWDVKRGHPDFPALVVAVAALGEHRHSGFRLYQQLREIRGLNYGDYAYPEYFEEESGSSMPAVNHPRSRQELTIWVRPVEPAHRLFAIRAALYEVDRWVRNGITQDELDGVRQFLAGYTLMLQQTPSRKLGDRLDDRFYGLRAPWLDALRTRLRTLSLDEVNAAIRRHVRPERLRIAVATHGAAELAQEIRTGAASPITYPTPKAESVLQADRLIERFPLGTSGPDDIRIVRAQELFER